MEISEAYHPSFVICVVAYRYKMGRLCAVLHPSTCEEDELEDERSGTAASARGPGCLSRPEDRQWC